MAPVMMAVFIMSFALVMLAFMNVTMGGAVIVAAAVPVSALIAALFSQDVAQQAAGRSAAYGVQWIALGNDGARSRAKTGAYQRIVGLAVARRCTAGHGESQQANKSKTSKTILCFHDGSIPRQ